MAHRRSGAAVDREGERGGSAPRGLEAFRLDVGGSEVAIFSFPLAPPEVPASLSRAEGEIALLLNRGLSRREIASARGRSLATINNQIRSLYGKLRVGSRGKLTIALRGPQ
jgi:DNA-binding CsgD family transcriptional regulator